MPVFQVVSEGTEFIEGDRIVDGVHYRPHYIGATIAVYQNPPRAAVVVVNNAIRTISLPRDSGLSVADATEEVLALYPTLKRSINRVVRQWPTGLSPVETKVWCELLGLNEQQLEALLVRTSLHSPLLGACIGLLKVKNFRSEGRAKTAAKLRDLLTNKPDTALTSIVPYYLVHAADKFKHAKRFIDTVNKRIALESATAKEQQTEQVAGEKHET